MVSHLIVRKSCGKGAGVIMSFCYCVIWREFNVINIVLNITKNILLITVKLNQSLRKKRFQHIEVGLKTNNVIIIIKSKSM